MRLLEQQVIGKRIEKLVIFLAFFMMMLGSQRIVAQTSLISPHQVYEGLSWFLKWDANGSRFAFFDPLLITDEYPSVNIEEDAWVEYNVLTNTLSRSKVWPLQPQLSQSQLELLNPGALEGDTSVMYSSPNKRYVVYARESSPDDYYGFRVTVADLETNIVVDTSVPISNPARVRDLFDVYWSEDGKSFVVKSRLYYSQLVTYFANYEESLSNLTSTTFDLEIGQRDFTLIDETQRVIDISPDGSQILMAVLEIPTTNPADTNWPTRLVVWNPKNSENSIILDDIDDSTVGALVFSSNNTLYLVTDQGLMSYDLLLRQSHVVDSTITYDASSFSPNATHIILYESIDRVYRLMVASFPLVSPDAHAGDDSIATALSDDSAIISLDASLSTDSDGVIVDYVWRKDDQQLATGVNPEVELSVGVHTIVLTVTDDDGATDSDEVVITVMEAAATLPASALY